VVVSTTSISSKGIDWCHSSWFDTQSFDYTVSSCIDSSDICLSDRLDEWISRQHTLLVVAQDTQHQSDQHKVVETDVGMCYIHLHWVVVISYFPSIKDNIKLEVEGSLSTSLRLKQIKTHVYNLRPFLFNHNQVNALEVAQQNEQEFVIRDIIAHRGDHHRRSSMEFLVRRSSCGTH